MRIKLIHGEIESRKTWRKCLLNSDTLREDACSLPSVASLVSGSLIVHGAFGGRQASVGQMTTWNEGLSAGRKFDHLKIGTVPDARLLRGLAHLTSFSCAAQVTVVLS